MNDEKCRTTICLENISFALHQMIEICKAQTPDIHPIAPEAIQSLFALQEEINKQLTIIADLG